MCREAVAARRRSACGMTLIELMVVMVVIALLGAVALPAYQSSVRKAHRAEAKSALTTAAQQLERFYTERSAYDASGASALVPAQSENGYYAIALPTAKLKPAEFQLTATPQGAQADDACGTFTLDQAGTRGVTGGSLSVAECW